MRNVVRRICAWCRRRDAAPGTGLRVRTAVPAACLGLLLAWPGPAIGGTIYSWKDDGGVVHFSNRKPPQGTEDVREIRYKPSKAPGGFQAGRATGAGRPKALPEPGGRAAASIPAQPARLPIPAPAPVPLPATSQTGQTGQTGPAGPGGTEARLAVDELRGLDPGAVKAIYARLLRECGSDPRCRTKVDNLMRGVRSD